MKIVKALNEVRKVFTVTTVNTFCALTIFIFLVSWEDERGKKVKVFLKENFLPFSFLPSVDERGLAGGAKKALTNFKICDTISIRTSTSETENRNSGDLPLQTSLLVCLARIV